MRWNEEAYHNGYRLALDRAEIIYIASTPWGNGGCAGYPECLSGMSADERVRRLKEMRFRVKREPIPQILFPEDYEEDGTPREWAQLSGGISVCLTSGFVCGK